MLTLPAAFSPDSATIWADFLLANGMKAWSRGPGPHGTERATYSIRGALPAPVTKALKAMVKTANAAGIDPNDFAAFKYKDYGDTVVSVRTK